MTVVIEHHRLAGRDWLNRPGTRAVLLALAAAGHEARIVGGTVRNALIGKPVSDLDIATTATPQQASAVASAAGWSVIPTGIAHGTVTVLVDHVPHEVTTLRRDVTTDGRRATVAFTADWAEDAGRRDFTINALYCDADGTVYDFTGGLADLAARRVRFIGDAGARIAEDFLRILRFFRFTAEYAAGVPDGAGLAACDAGRAGLAQLSAERVRAEFLRLLAAEHAVAMIRVMHAHGYLPPLLGAAPSVPVFERLIAIETAIGQAPDPLLRLAALAVGDREEARRLGARLRLANAETDLLSIAGAARGSASGEGTEHADRVALYRLGEAAFRAQRLVDWARSDRSTGDARERTRFDLPARWTVPQLPLDGRDVMAAGVAAGPQIGVLLRALEAWWIERDFEPDRVAALDELRRRIDERT